MNTSVRTRCLAPAVLRLDDAVQLVVPRDFDMLSKLAEFVGPPIDSVELMMTGASIAHVRTTATRTSRAVRPCSVPTVPCEPVPVRPSPRGHYVAQFRLDG
jgi:hypothetical protein